MALGVFKVDTDPFGLAEAKDGDEFVEGFLVVHVAHRLELFKGGYGGFRYRC